MFGFPLPYYSTGVTVELREIVESGVNIWDFEYPVPRASIEYNGKTCTVDFDKATFEKKIVDHFYFRQIGQETVGRWLYYFRSRVREIMPYYVQLYEFDAKFRNIEDPLESYNLLEEFERTHSANGSTTSEDSSDTSGSVTRNASGSSEKTGTQDMTRKFSNTPQGSVSNLDNYLTEATVENVGSSEGLETSENGSETSEGSATANHTGSTTDSGEEKYKLSKRGNIGVQPLGGEVENIRAAIINIDTMVINDLKDLFLQVY